MYVITGQLRADLPQLVRSNSARGGRGAPLPNEYICIIEEDLECLSYVRGAPRPVVPGVLRTADGVVNLRPNAMSRPCKADSLPKLPVRSPPSSAARGPEGG